VVLSQRNNKTNLEESNISQHNNFGNTPCSTYKTPFKKRILAQLHNRVNGAIDSYSISKIWSEKKNKRRKSQGILLGKIVLAENQSIEV